MSAFVIERRKSKRSWILLFVAALLVGVNALNGIGNYLSNLDAFEAQGTTWQAVWGQAGLLWATLFLPFLIALRAASLTRMEHEQANWRRLASYGAHLRAYRGKLLLVVEFVLLCQAIFVVVMIGAGAVLGFPLAAPDVGAMLCWGLLGGLGGTTVAAIQLLVGVFVRSFASTVAIGMVASLGSLLVTLAAPLFGVVYPHAQIGAGMRVRTLQWPSLSETVGFVGWNTLLICAAIFVGMTVLRRREH